MKDTPTKTFDKHEIKYFPLDEWKSISQFLNFYVKVDDYKQKFVNVVEKHRGREYTQRIFVGLYSVEKTLDALDKQEPRCKQLVRKRAINRLREHLRNVA